MNETLQNLLLSILVAIAPVLTGFLVTYIKKKTSELSIKISNAKINDKINQAVQIITDAVETTTQTYVETLKKEGNFNKEAQEKAFMTSKQAAIDLLSEDTVMLIRETYGDFDKWIEMKIESLVRKTKLETQTT